MGRQRGRAGPVVRYAGTNTHRLVRDIEHQLLDPAEQAVQPGFANPLGAHERKPFEAYTRSDIEQQRIVDEIGSLAHQSETCESPLRPGIELRKHIRQGGPHTRVGHHDPQIRQPLHGPQ